MASMSSIPVSPAVSALLPHDDRGGALIASGWSLTCLATFFLGLRVYCKIASRRGLWWDDWILISAWVTLVINAALVTHLVLYHTFGRHTWDFRTPDFDAFVLVLAVRGTFTVTAIAWTKTAFAVTLLRLTDGWTKAVLWSIIITINVAMGTSALFFWVGCTPVQKAWTPSIRGGSCLDHSIFIQVHILSGAYSAAMDFVLALIPWKILLGLNMKRTERLGAAIAMSMGVIAGSAAVVKVVKLPNLSSPDLYNSVDLVICDITEAAVSMAGACIPVLRVLIRDATSVARRLSDPTWTSQKSDGSAMSCSTSRGKSLEDTESEREMSVVGSPVSR